MKNQVVLDAEDIVQLIAKAYSVDTSKVDLGTYVDVEGYGKREHYVNKLRAVVEIPMTEKEFKA